MLIFKAVKTCNQTKSSNNPKVIKFYKKEHQQPINLVFISLKIILFLPNIHKAKEIQLQISSTKTKTKLKILSLIKNQKHSKQAEKSKELNLHG